MSFVKKHKNDILLVAAVLLLAFAAWLYLSLSRTGGGEAVVSVDGEEIMRLPLGNDCVTVIGEGVRSNTLVISGGQAYISEASCADHVCMRRGRVSFNGETIVCLPNGLVVSIEGGENSEVDGVAG